MDKYNMVKCRGVSVSVSSNEFVVNEGVLKGLTFKTWDQLDKAVYDVENSAYYDSIKYVRESDIKGLRVLFIIAGLFLGLTLIVSVIG